MNDFYNRPLPWRPYYYIHNVNTSDKLPTNPYTAPEDKGLGTGTDSSKKQDSTEGVANFTRTIKIGTADQSVVEKNAPLDMVIVLLLDVKSDMVMILQCLH